MKINPYIRKSRPRDLKLFVFISVFVIQRLYSFNQIGVQTQPDSPTYRSISKQGTLFDFQNIRPDSLRPFPVNFLYAILVNDTLRILFQVLLAVFAWSVLIFSLIKCLAVGKHERYVWIFISFLAFSPALVYRDITIMPESITLSVTILFLASIVKLRLERNFDAKNYFLFFVLLLFLVIQRPVVSVLVLLFLCFSLPLLVRKEGKNYLTRNKKILVLSMLIAIIGLTYNSQNSRDDWPKNISSTFPVYRDSITPGLQMWENNSYHSVWRDFYIKNGLPECAQNFSKYSGPWDYSIGVFGECKKANEWVGNRFWELQIKSIIEEPTLVAKTFVRFGLESLVPTPTTYRLQQMGLDTVLAEFPTFEIIGLDKLAGKNYLISWNSFLFAFIFFIYLGIRLNHYGSHQKQNLEFFAGAFFAIFSGLFLTVLIMPSDVFRTALPLNYLLVFIIFFMLLPTSSRKNTS
jgi:hypothetical protein